MYLIFLVHYLVILCQIKVFKVSSDATNEKGTSVKVRDYTRSCEFYSVLHTLYDHCLLVGRSCRQNKSEDLPLSNFRCFREIEHQR